MEGRQETETWIDMTCRVEVEYLFSGLWMGKGEGGAERERRGERDREGEKWGEAKAKLPLERKTKREQAQDRS